MNDMTNIISKLYNRADQYAISSNYNANEARELAGNRMANGKNMMAVYFCDLSDYFMKLAANVARFERIRKCFPETFLGDLYDSIHGYVSAVIDSNINTMIECGYEERYTEDYVFVNIIKEFSETNSLDDLKDIYTAIYLHDLYIKMVSTNWSDLRSKSVYSKVATSQFFSDDLPQEGIVIEGVFDSGTHTTTFKTTFYPAHTFLYPSMKIRKFQTAEFKEIESR